MKNYPSISNLTVISKLLVCVILQWLHEHLKVNNLQSVQSAYRKCHSTETAIARVLSDILMALHCGDVAACWTCLLRSTWSIIASYCIVSVYHMASAERHSAGSARTWPIDSSASGMLECSQRMTSSSLGCLRAPSSDRYCLYCTLQILHC